MNRIVSFSLIIYFFLIFAENKAGESRVCGTDARCTCSRDNENITAVCRMSDLGNISQSFSTPAGVNSLNVSNNEIRAIELRTFETFSGLINLEMSQNLLEELLPNRFAELKNLLNLSLTYNNIQVIHKDAFSGLHCLEILNLTGNKLQTWNARGSSIHLPSLVIIDVQGNMGWRPEEKYLLELPRLKEVRNVSWAAECLDCWFIKNVSEELIDIFNHLHFQSVCFKEHYIFSDYLMLLARHRFVIKKCRSLIHCIEQKEANVTTSYTCWPTFQRVFSTQLLFGIIGGCLNLIVFVNILSTKSLRKNVSMVLVSNLALGDTLIGMHSAIMAAIIINIQYEDWFKHSGSISEIQCPRVGPLWVLGQCTASLTSFTLTLERYLCIVFSMKPGIRMTPRLASLAIALNWIVAAFMMFLAFHLKFFQLNNLCISFVYSSRYPVETLYTIVMVSAGVTLYLVTIPLYIHIYSVVKRSSQQMGVQRESALAKRIAILVGTNLVFFFIPIIYFVIRASAATLLESVIPLYCLTFNSCLNPLVHAFRNDKFKNALKRKLALRCNTSNVTPAVQTGTPGGVRYTRKFTPAVQAATPGVVRNTRNLTSAAQTVFSGGEKNVTTIVQAASSGGVRDISSVTPAENLRWH